jgi:hypothetical protein
MSNIARQYVVRIAVLAVVCTFAAQSQGQVCNFVTTGTTMTLTNNCTASQTILIPDGFTLDGKSHMITAVADPVVGTFSGNAVVANSGTTAFVKNLLLDEPNVPSSFPTGCGGFAGIQFKGASGSIVNSSVLHVGQGCGVGAGLAISVFNAPCDGTHLNTQTVTITGNKLFASEIAIDAECDVRVNASGNLLTAPGFSVFFVNGAAGTINNNQIETDASGTGTAIYLQGAAPSSVKITNNNINLLGGIAGVGINLQSDGVSVTGNRFFNYGLATGIGINNVGASHGGTDNKITNNQIRCYATPFMNAGGNGNSIAACPF